MFNIDSTGTIRITKGEDSGDFNLTLFEDRSYGHSKCWVVKPLEIYKMPSSLYVWVNKDVFKEKVLYKSGYYCFEYSYPKLNISTDPEHPKWIRSGPTGWYLGGSTGSAIPTKINLTDYGLTYSGTPKYLDVIIIRYYEYDIDEVAFRIQSLYSSEVLKEKKFSSADDTLVGDFGDVVLNLTAADLLDLAKGEYRYLVFLNSYDMNTVTSLAITRILPFYIL